MKKAVLIDVSAVMYRAYFSLMNMRNSKQEPTGAVYGFINILLSVIDEFKPDYIAGCFDVRRSSLKRKEEFENYKENRSAVPEELLVQIPMIERCLEVFGIEKFKIEGYEADDVIGTLSCIFDKENIETIVVTGDKDLSQLIGDKKVSIALLGKGEGKERFKLIKTKDDVKEQLGVYPELIPDLFGLQGDTSDGIPGVKGIGNKTAVKLLEEFGTLDGIYENIESIKGKTGEKLVNDREMAYISKKLATIECCLDINLDYNKIKIKEIDKVNGLKFFKELEFKTLIKKFGLADLNEESDFIEEKIVNVDMSKFEYEILNSDSIKNIDISKIKIVISNEAGITIADAEKVYYIPLFHSYLGASNVDFLLLKEKLSGFKGAVYDLKSVLKKGIILDSNFDLFIAFYLLYPEEAYNFEWFIKNVTSIELTDFKEKFGKTEENNLSIEESAQFFCERVYIAEKTVDFLKEEIKNKKLDDLFTLIEMPLIKVLSEIEKTGIKIDTQYLNSYNFEVTEKLHNIEKNIFISAGCEFNINSPKQLSDVLFNRIGISTAGVKKTKTGISTDTEVLELLAERGEKIADELLEYRKYSKLKSTYLEALPKLVDSKGRIHTTFNQNGTATGRLSSTNPNLQNIPAKTEEGMRVRGGFISEGGYSLVSFDYSQIELRVLAELSKDKTLVEAYNNNLDLHTLTAMKIFEKGEDEITREDRTIAKVVNFSIIYGKTPFGLSKEINISMSDAKRYIDKYFEEYSGVRKFLDDTIKDAELKGYVSTYFGRNRAIQGITSSNKNIKSQADRMAVNSVIQGTAADILKIVMVKLYNKYKDKEDIKMVLQVHDELIFEIKDEKVENYSKEIAEIMENEIKFQSVKLVVNYAFGKKWSDTK